MKRIVLVGGGSAGHVTPNLALVPGLRRAGFEVHYVGTRAGIERGLAQGAGLTYHVIDAGKLRRYFDLRNLTDLWRVLRGAWGSLRVLRRLRPAVVFSKGGFVSCPLVWAAWLCRIPVVAHESDLTPGLANRLSSPFAKKVCFSFPETAALLDPAKAVLTGIPVRAFLHRGRAAPGRALCGFGPHRPVLLVVGGSQGAARVNQAVRAALPALLADFQICHLCGAGHLDSDLDARPGYRQFEFAGPELADLLAMADLVVSRAGATSLFEILALRKPSLLVPLSRQASRGDQIANARSFQQQGFSQVLSEEGLDPRSLEQAVRQTYARREGMVAAMKSSPLRDSTREVVAVVAACSGR